MQIQDLFSVKDKAMRYLGHQVILVTGGGRGVGEMIAAGYVANGAKVYISSRSASACDETAARLSKSGPGKCFSIPADLSSFDECVRVVKELEKRETKLDVLVNNSGATWGEPLESYPDAAWTKLMVLNVQRVFTLTQKLLPMLQKSEGVGRVINIGSVNGVNPPGMDTYAYSASKAALHQLSRHLAGQVGPKITVNTLALGPFRSKMMAATLDSFEAEIAGSLPAQRIGAPEDVAAACLWLSGKGGEWITGTIVPVDGGSLAGGRAKL